MRTLLALFLLLSLTINAADNLIKDPSFKKYKTEWWMGVGQEYKSYKISFKRKIFKTELKHTSAPHYFSLAALVEPETASKYKFSMDLKCDGEGTIYVRTVNSVQGLSKIDRAAEIAKRQRQANLGLSFKITEFKKDWTNYTCYFTAKENPYSIQNDAFNILMGSYQGEIEIKNISIEKVDVFPEGTKENILATKSSK